MQCNKVEFAYRYEVVEADNRYHQEAGCMMGNERFWKMIWRMGMVKQKMEDFGVCMGRV